MVDVPISMPRQPRALPWRALFASVIFSVFILLALNCSLADTTLANEALNCRTKFGKMADRVISFVLNTDRKCEDSKLSDPLPLGVP